MLKFEQFMQGKASERFVYLAERISHADLILCVQEAFDRTIQAFPKARVELLQVYNEAVGTETTPATNVYRDPRPDPSTPANPPGTPSAPDQASLNQYIVNLAHSIINATNKKFPGMKINSRFLAELFNAVAKVAGRQIVDPERGGMAMNFSSTRGEDGKTAPLKVNWMDVPGDKNKYAFNLLLYFMKYTRDINQAQELIRRSVDFNTLKPNYKTAVNKAIAVAVNQYNSGVRQPFNNPLPGAQPPAQVAQDTIRNNSSGTDTVQGGPAPAANKPDASPVGTGAAEAKKKTPKWKKETGEPEGDPNPPALPQKPTETDIDNVLNWYFNPKGYNRDNIKTDNFGNPTVSFGGTHMDRDNIKDLLMQRYKPQPTVNTDAAGVSKMVPDYTDKKGNVKMNGQSLPAKELIDRLSGKYGQDTNRVTKPEDLDAQLAGIPDDALMSNPFGTGKIRKRDLVAMLKSRMG